MIWHPQIHLKPRKTTKVEKILRRHNITSGDDGHTRHLSISHHHIPKQINPHIYRLPYYHVSIEHPNYITNHFVITIQTKCFLNFGPNAKNLQTTAPLKVRAHIDVDGND